MGMDLITSESSVLLRQICEAVDVEQIRTMIKQLEAIKTALEAVNRFHEKSVIYAQLEAEALVRLIDLGGIKYLRGYRRKAAEWIASMSKQDRDKYINMCKDGLTITAVFQRETNTYGLYHQTRTEVTPWNLMTGERIIIMDAASDGDDSVDLTSFSNYARQAFSTEDAANEAIDGLRHKLRQLNYVSVGDKSGKYIPVKKSNNTELWGAIRCRVHGIMDDIERIGEICNEAKLTFKSTDFVYGNWKYQQEVGDTMRCVLMALKSIGVLTEIEEYDNLMKRESK